MRKISSTIIFVIFLLSCKSQKISFNQIKEYGKNVAISDSTLKYLQQQNDLLLVFADENFSWSRITQYKILALSNGKWNAYSYNAKNFLKASANLPPATSLVQNKNVSSSSCDSIWQFFVKHEVWKIKGDEGKNFCGNENKNCNINDATYWRLMIITKTKQTDASYYAPEFFEQCCPGNTDRQTFIEAVKKIQVIANNDED
jgi:hypothetical protein